MVVAGIDDLLPLADHPELLVVEQGDLDRDVVGDEGHQLLERHLEPAVTGDRPGLAIGSAEGGAHGRRQAEAHRPKAARRHVRVGLAKAGVAGQPHLVLADVRDVGRLVVGQFPDPLDDVVRRQQALAPRPGAVPRRRLRIALPVGQLIEILATRVWRGFGHHRGERSQDPPGVTDDRDLDGDVLADLRGVDVDLDDPCVWGIGSDVAGHPVVEPHADGDQQVGALDGAVDVLPAVHAHVAVGQGMGLVDRPDAEQRPGDRDRGLLGEGAQVVPRFGVEHAVAGQDDRSLGGGDLRRGGLELAAVAVHVGPKAGQAGHDVCLARVLGAGLLLEGVLGDVDVDRAGPAGAGDVERLGDHPGQVVGIADQVVVLGHRQGDAVDVDLLEGILADERRGHVAGDRDHRHRIEEGRPDPGDEVRGTRPRRAHAHADLAGHPGVAVGGVGTALFVANEHVAQLGIVAEHVVQRQDHATRVAEEDIDTLAQERLAQYVGTDARALQVARVIQHPLPGVLDGGGVSRPLTRDVAAPSGRGAGGGGGAPVSGGTG